MKSSFSRLTWFALLGFAMPLATLAQNGGPVSASSQLPPEAQALEAKGIMATKIPDYLLAIQYFQEAQKLAPNSPELLYNLGLAESKIPGRELRAISWLGAYLIVEPKAQNTAAVIEQMQLLDVKSQSNLLHIIASAQDAGSKIPDDLGLPPNMLGQGFMGEPKQRELAALAELWAKAQDFSAAWKSAAIIISRKGSEWQQYWDEAREHIAIAEADAGNFKTAEETAGQIERRDYRDLAISCIVRNKAGSGDFSGAQATANMIGDKQERYEAWVVIARLQIGAGDHVGGEKTAMKIAADWGSSSYEDLAKMALGLKAVGDAAGAAIIANLIPDAELKGRALGDVDSWSWFKGHDDPYGRMVSASEWTNDLWIDGLTHDIFLDLSGYLVSLHSDDPQKMFYLLYDAAKRLADAQTIIDRKLKAQLGQQARP
jgi:tetratricopeptide (TPR) repeat protein